MNNLKTDYCQMEIKHSLTKYPVGDFRKIYLVFQKSLRSQVRFETFTLSLQSEMTLRVDDY